MYLPRDGTGVPGRHQELVGIKSKQSDGNAKTYEAKIGATLVVEYTVDGKHRVLTITTSLSLPTNPIKSLN